MQRHGLSVRDVQVQGVSVDGSNLSLSGLKGGGVQAAEVSGEAVVSSLESSSDEGVSESAGPLRGEDVGGVELVVGTSDSSLNDIDGLAIGVLDVSGEALSSDDVDKHTAGGGGLNGTFTIAEVVLPVDFQLNGGEDSVEGSNHVQKAVEGGLVNLGLFDGDLVLEVSNLLGKVVILGLGDSDVSPDSLDSDFELSDLGLDGIGLVSQLSDGGFQLVDGVPGSGDLGIVGGNEGLALGDGGLESSLGVSGGVELVLEVSDPGFGLSELEPVVGQSVSLVIVGLLEDADFLFETGDSSLIGGNLALDFVVLLVKGLKLTHEVLKLGPHLVKPEVVPLVLEAVDLGLESSDLSLGTINDDLELVSGELFLLDGGSDPAQELEKVRNDLAAGDGVVRDKGLDGLKDGDGIGRVDDLVEFGGGGESGEKRVDAPGGGLVDAPGIGNGVVDILGSG